MINRMKNVFQILINIMNKLEEDNGEQLGWIL
jgi:hypothetical protein